MLYYIIWQTKCKFWLVLETWSFFSILFSSTCSFCAMEIETCYFCIYGCFQCSIKTRQLIMPLTPFLCCSSYAMGNNISSNGSMPVAGQQNSSSLSSGSSQSGKEYDFSSLTQGFFTKHWTWKRLFGPSIAHTTQVIQRNSSYLSFYFSSCIWGL